VPHKDKDKAREYFKEYNKNRPNKKEYHAEYRERNHLTLVPQARLNHVRRKYNLDAADYLQMINEQGNLCAICKQPETWTTKYGDVRPLAVDHCHKTGKVRGLLCTRCNATLGYVDDNVQILKDAIAYLENHKGD
jgi:hypothetical protein